MKLLWSRIQTLSSPNPLTPVLTFLEKDKASSISQIWLLAGLLAFMMLGPIWVGQYAPLYDYPNHLLEAQILAHYTDPQLDYPASYAITPGWYWHSNALSTLLLAGLGRVMPITIAGQVVLSLYILLFASSLAWLLYRAGTAWPLLLAMPVLVYNFTFTSGWLNLCYGMALACYALILYDKWRVQKRRTTLLMLGGVLLLLYIAHLVVWGLTLIVIASLAAPETFQRRRYAGLWLALNSAWPILFFAWWPLALLTPFLGPAIWVGVALLHRWHLDLRWVVGGAIGLAGILLIPIKLQEETLQAIAPQLEYYINDKLTFPLRLFTLPHQYMPPNPALISYNLVVLGLILIITLILIRTNISRLLNDKSWLLAAGILSVVYILIPSHTPYTWITEPRVLFIIVLVTLPMIRLPAEGAFSRRALTISLALLCLVSLIGITRYAQVYDQQAAAWQTQMAQLQPARRILLLREKTSPYISQPTLLGSFNRFYTGEYFSTTYNITYGGLASRTFINGPVYIDPDVPVPAYDSPGFGHNSYVAERCPELRAAYEAVLFWGQPHPDDPMVKQLNECFTAGPQWADMGIWYTNWQP